MKDYKKSILKIYEKSDLPLKIEVSPKTAADIMVKINILERDRIVNGLTKSIFDLNPQYGKLVTFLALTNKFFEKISFIYEEDTFDVVVETLKKIELESNQLWSGNKRDFSKIKKFASVNLYIDFVTNGNETAKQIWNNLDTHQILISNKSLPNTYPIDTIESSFIDLNTKGRINIYRKTWSKHGLPSRFGVSKNTD
tara:strand:+ start:1909 stop:2499 length:591 start_codon:yes stop_codon:yes gene_type:complete